MIIKKAEFVTSQTRYSPPGDLPEIAVVGRSNVGKSSLINRLTHRKKLARTSSEPGRTRLINYFCVNDAFMLVDLPGYGFAKGAKAEVRAWGEMIDAYLNSSRHLRHVFVLLDIRHEPNDNDKLMLDYLYKTNRPFTVVATKADKLSRARLPAAVGVIANALGLGRDNILVTSGVTGLGEESLLQKIAAVLAPEDEA